VAEGMKACMSQIDALLAEVAERGLLPAEVPAPSTG
jgi:hypothetical protein